MVVTKAQALQLPFAASPEAHHLEVGLQAQYSKLNKPSDMSYRCAKQWLNLLYQTSAPVKYTETTVSICSL